jgi:hypothetical protein
MRVQENLRHRERYVEAEVWLNVNEALGSTPSTAKGSATHSTSLGC